MLVTSSRIKLLTTDLQTCRQTVQFQQGELVAFDLKKGTLLVGLQGGKVAVYRPTGDQLLLVSSTDLGSEISSLALTQDGQFACISLLDAPLYTLVVVSLQEPEQVAIVERRSLLSVLDYEAYQDAVANTVLAHEATLQTQDEEMREDEELSLS